MDPYSEGLHVIRDLLLKHANEHDRTIQDALIDLRVIVDGYQDEEGQASPKRMPNNSSELEV